MAKEKSRKSEAKNESASQGGRVMLRLAVLVIVLVGAAAGLRSLRTTIERRYLFTPGIPQIVLKNRPAWMCDYLADQIVQQVRPLGTHSALEREVLDNAVQVLQANGWVKEVRQVRRVYGKRPGDTIEIDCDFRAPVAMVEWEGQYWLVDNDGVRLPDCFPPDRAAEVMFGRDRDSKRVEIRVIQNVKNPPPHNEGQKWPGDDVTAGLELVKLLHGLDWADEVWRVDVGNFAGRRSNTAPQIVLTTSYRTGQNGPDGRPRFTEIYWGEPVKGPFYAEVRPDEKLQRLCQVQKKYGRIDAGKPWLDIRFDAIEFPTPTANSNER